MSATIELEQRYRRLLAFYPRAFRRENEEEILAVLIEGAREGQRRPGAASCADLLRSAIGMRLRPGAPRSAPTVFWAVRLMYVGAAVELGVLITLLATLGNLRAAIAQHNPGYTTTQWHAEVHAHIAPLVVFVPIVVSTWLWMAWANGRGHRWARVVFVALFAITTLSLSQGVAQGAGMYAPADLVAGSLLWLVMLVSVALIFSPRSRSHYRREPAHR